MAGHPDRLEMTMCNEFRKSRDAVFMLIGAGLCAVGYVLVKLFI